MTERLRTSGNTPYTVIGVYTLDYLELARRCVNSLADLSISSDFRLMPDQGGWSKNTRHKPAVIREMIKEYKDRPLVCLDADAVVKRPPTLFDELSKRKDIDIGAFILDLSKYRPGPKVQKIQGGTLFLNPTKTTQEIVDEWAKECERCVGVGNQPILNYVLKKISHRFFPLPEEYCVIFDLMSSVKDPVIIHYQASREHRRARP